MNLNDDKLTGEKAEAQQGDVCIAREECYNRVELQ